MFLFDLWQAFPRQVFTPYSCLLISAAFVVVNHVDYLRVTGVIAASAFTQSGLEATMYLPRGV